MAMIPVVPRVLSMVHKNLGQFLFINDLTPPPWMRLELGFLISTAARNVKMKELRNKTNLPPVHQNLFRNVSISVRANK